MKQDAIYRKPSTVHHKLIEYANTKGIYHMGADL